MWLIPTVKQELLLQHICLCLAISPSILLPASLCMCLCLSPPTVCVGVCLCVCMCSLSDSISQGSRGSCQKVVALVSLARKMSISCTNPEQKGTLLDSSREKIIIRKGSKTSQIHHQSQTKQTKSDSSDTNQHLCLFFPFTLKQTMWLISAHLMGSSHCDRGLKLFHTLIPASWKQYVCCTPIWTVSASWGILLSAQPPWASLNELGRPE